MGGPVSFVSLTKSVILIIYPGGPAGRGAWRRSDGKYDLEKSHPIKQTLAATILDFGLLRVGVT